MYGLIFLSGFFFSDDEIADFSFINLLKTLKKIFQKKYEIDCHHYIKK